jgi:carotenoid cleavage dioxygenase-like enzyme
MKGIQNANITIQEYADKMVALTESPLPVIFDAKTLGTLGAFTFQDLLPVGQWEAAHSQLDVSAGETVSYCIQFGEKTSYIIWKLAGHQANREIIAEIPVEFPAYMHSFALTEHYVILVAFPFIVNPLNLMEQKKPFIFNYKWTPKNGTIYYIVDRSTGEVSTIKGDPFFAFHHINAFDKDGNIFIDIVTYPNADIIDVAAGRITDENKIKESEKTKIERFTISMAGKSLSRETLFDQTTEMPRVPADRTAHEYRYSYLIDVAFPTSIKDQRSLYKVDAETKTAKSWSEQGCSPGEPIFVPRPNSQAEDDGAVLSLVLDFANHRSFLLILDAKDLSEFARVEAPHAIPLGLHGLWKAVF